MVLHMCVKKDKMVLHKLIHMRRVERILEVYFHDEGQSLVRLRRGEGHMSMQEEALILVEHKLHMKGHMNLHMLVEERLSL